MKSPRQLSRQLAKQWQSADKREQRLLTGLAWPIRLAIIKPTATEIKNAAPQVAEHIKQWRKETLAHIEWQTIRYQASSETIEIPTYWCIQNQQQWIAACKDMTIEDEYKTLSKVIEQVDAQFHQIIVRQKKLCLKSTAQQLLHTCALVMQLYPGCAQGKPLRALALANVDTKFIETHRQLITQLLSMRFKQALASNDLEQFLGAASNNEHWLLVVALDKKSLPFKKMRLTASELHILNLPCHNILIVENEQCLHQLPYLDNCIAILGAGLNLSWLSNPNFSSKNLAYWGDIDSWGLKMLAIAKQHQAKITPLMMDLDTFQRHKKMAVIEPKIAHIKTQNALNEAEQKLYQLLISLAKGRLEQEFIHECNVKECLHKWIQDPRFTNNEAASKS